MKWEALPLADRAKLMAAAVRNGYTDIRSIKEAYANYLNLKQSAGNRHDDGGFIVEGIPENLLTPERYTQNRFPIANSIEINAYNDPAFNPNAILGADGYGYTEYMDKDTQLLPYYNWYQKPHQYEGRPITIYNGHILGNNSNEAVALDAISHGLRDQDDLWKYYYLPNLENAFISPKSDAGIRIEQEYNNWKNNNNNGNDDPEVYKQIKDNVIDGIIRSLLVRPSQVEALRYDPMAYEHLVNTEAKLKAWNEARDYINSYRLNEVAVTPNQNAYGGNLFAKGSQINNAKPKYNNIGGVQGFLNLLDKKGIKYIKSSGYRPNAKTKSGNDSWHSKLDQWGNSQAVDLVFSDFEKARKAIYSDPELVAYLMNNKLGLLEETTSGIMAKTGASGKHFHLGPDRWALQMRDNAIKQFDATYHPMQDVTWQDVQARKKQFELTPEEERLYNSKPTLFYNADYTNWNDPSTSKTFELAYAPYALNSELDNSPSNGWALYNSLLNSQSQNDQLSWMAMMTSLSPKTTPEQKEAASTMYQLFAPQDGDYSYHGLNFAAYGGKVNRFGLGGDEQSVLPEVEVTGTVPKVSFTGCVPAARHALAEHLGISDQGVGALYNLYGNAWDIANSAYMTSLPFSQQSAQPGDLVVMSRPSLQSDEKRGIPTSNQHVGLIILTPDGLRVKHYTGGDKYNIDNLNSIMLNDTGLRYTPTTLLRIPLDSNTPEYTGLPGKTNGFVIQPFWGAGLKSAAEALNSLDLADEALLSNDEDFDLKLATMAALGVESDFGGSNRATARHFFPGLTNIVKSVKRGEPQLKSEGYISMKPNTYLQNTVYSDLQDAYTAGDLSRSELWKQTTQRTAQNALNPFSLWKGSPVGGTSPSSAARTMAYLGIDPQTLARSVGDDAKILYGALVNLRKRYPDLSAKQLVEKYRGSKLPDKYDAIVNSINEGVPYMDSWYNNLLQSINTGYDNVKNTLIDFGSRYTENIAKLLNDLHIPFTGANFRGIAADLAHRKDTFTEDDLSNREFNTLRDIARKEWRSGKKALDYSSYTEEGDIGSGGTSVPMKMVHGVLKNIYDPAMSLQNLIGQGGLYVDDNGHLHVLDEYDFNNQGTKPSFFRSFIENPSPYGLIRSLGTVYGSAPGAGRKLDIDVGPVYSGGGGSW